MCSFLYFPKLPFFISFFLAAFILVFIRNHVDSVDGFEVSQRFDPIEIRRHEAVFLPVKVRTEKSHLELQS